MALGPLQDEFRKHTQEAEQMAAFRQQAIDMGFKGDETIAGVIKTAAAATKDAQGAITDMAEKRAKERFDDAMFLAMLSDLDAQIAAKQDEIDGLSEQIAAAQELLGIIGRDGDVDPTDPAQMRLLNLLKIPEEEWGTVTKEQIEARLDVLEDKRDVARSQRDRLIEERQDLAAVADASIGEKRQAVDQKLDENFDEMMVSRPEQIKDEAAWFKAEIETLEVYASSLHRADEIYTLVDDLADSTKYSLSADPEFNGLAADFLRTEQFIEQYYNRIQGLRGGENYEKALSSIVDRLEPMTKEALVRSANTPDDVQDYLKDRFPDSSFEHFQKLDN